MNIMVGLLAQVNMLDFQNFHDPLEGQRANSQVVFEQMLTAKLEADKPEGLW